MHRQNTSKILDVSKGSNLSSLVEFFNLYNGRCIQLRRTHESTEQRAFFSIIFSIQRASEADQKIQTSTLQSTWQQKCHYSSPSHLGSC